MSHVNHNGNRHVEHIADPENPVLASAQPIANSTADPDPPFTITTVTRAPTSKARMTRKRSTPR